MSNFNKVVTNIPVSLTETEMSNLSKTFSGIIQGGGGGEGKRYIGDGVYVTVNNDANPGVISLTQTSLDKLNQDIPSAVSSFQDSIQYAKKTELPDSITDFDDTSAVIYSYINPLTGDIQSQINTKQNKLQFDLNAKGEISAIGPLNNTTALAGANGITGDYYSASNPSGFITSSVSELDNFYSKTDTSSKTEIANAFDNIPKYILNGDSNITATSAQDGNNVRWDLAVNAKPVVTDTTLTGDKGIYTHTTTKSGEWCVELVQSAYAAINDVQNKLDTTVAAQIYQPKGDYVSSTDISDMATKTWVGTQGYITVIPSEYVTDTELQTTLSDYATNTLVQNTSAAIIELMPVTAGLASETDLQIVSAGVNYVSAHAITAHQSLTNYYTKSETSGATELSTEFGKYALKSEIPTVPTKVSDLTDSGNYYQKTETSSKTELSTEFAKYLTNTQYNTDSATFALKTDLNDLVSSAGITTEADYVMTNSGWKVLTLPGGGMTQVIHDETLTGQGNASDNKLGVVWSALSGNTINSALSAGSATSAYKAASASAAKRLQDSTEGPIIQVNDITALQNWASSNSSTWDGVSAKLGTAQYANDSATFVTSSNDSISAAGEQYALTTTGWSKIQAGSTLTAGSGVEIVSNGINALLGTDLSFNATTSAIQINTNGIVYGAYAFVEGSNTTASGAGAHAEGVDAGAIGQGAHAGGYGTHTTGVGNFIHGTFLNFASPDGTSVSNTPVFVGGTLNATTSQDYTDHGGYLQIMGNGTYTGGGQGNNSDAYILYRDGTVSAKQFQNADGTETINGTTYNFSGVDNIEILPNAATANTANFPNDNVLRFILES